MRILNGSELAGFIKERQAKQVRGLRQAYKIFPKLAIICTTNDPASAAYMRLKKVYGEDILVEVEEHFIDQSAVPGLISQLNANPNIHGIILQLPLAEPKETDQLLDLVAPSKDVDGLGQHPIYDPATPTAILWLLNGYNIDLTGKNIVVVGHGRLVGRPLTKMLRAQGYTATPVEADTESPEQIMREADILITGVGKPGLIKANMVKPGAVLVDAGTAADKGKLVGDVELAVRERHDLTITPIKGGVGPLTVCALFDNVIRAASEGLNDKA